MSATVCTCRPRRRITDRPHPATAYRLFLLFSTLHLALLCAAAITLWMHYS